MWPEPRVPGRPAASPGVAIGPEASLSAPAPAEGAGRASVCLSARPRGCTKLRRFGWDGRMAARSLLEAGLARVLFYPSLLYTLFRGKLPGPAHRDWYHRIDRTVLLGALPLRGMTTRVSRAGRAGLPGEEVGPPALGATATARRPELS